MESRKLIYYFDGSNAKVGDSVSLTDGQQTGKVTFVLDSPSDLMEWELETPGLMIESSFAGLVFYDQDQLIRDEVKLQTGSSK